MSLQRSGLLQVEDSRQEDLGLGWGKAWRSASRACLSGEVAARISEAWQEASSETKLSVPPSSLLLQDV